MALNPDDATRYAVFLITSSRHLTERAVLAWQWMSGEKRLGMLFDSTMLKYSSSLSCAVPASGKSDTSNWI